MRNPIEFDRLKAESGDNSFTLTPQQWIKATDAIGIKSETIPESLIIFQKYLIFSKPPDFTKNQ